jgi:hypothetical protein
VRKCATPGVGRSKYGGEGPLFDMSGLGLSTGVQQDLEEAARHSLARKTWATYNTAERMLEKFCKDKGHKLVWPLQESTLLNFIHWLAYDRGVSAATINGYLAGVRKIHVVRGFPEPQFRTQLVKMVLEGRKNMEAADRLRRRTGGRQPVTVDIMKLIKNRLVQWNAPKEDKLTTWAVCSLLFHGAFRGGEILCRSAVTFDPACSLTRQDIMIVEDVKDSDRSMVQVRVKMPKEDRKGEITVVDVYQTESDICPVRAVKKWKWATAGAEEDQPAFRFDSGLPVTAANLNAILKERLEGFLEEKISTHSFRIGAASRMGQIGMSDREVQAIGRWGSRAFETYLRLPRTKRMMVARRLGEVGGGRKVI